MKWYLSKYALGGFLNHPPVWNPPLIGAYVERPLFREARTLPVRYTAVGTRLHWPRMRVILSLALLACFCCLALAQMKGDFTTKGGSRCKWEETHYQGPDTSILLHCTCKNKDRERMEYSCEYFGDPSRCSKLKVQGGAERFYHGMAYFLSSKFVPFQGN